MYKNAAEQHSLGMLIVNKTCICIISVSKSLLSIVELYLM